MSYGVCMIVIGFNFFKNYDEEQTRSDSLKKFSLRTPNLQGLEPILGEKFDAINQNHKKHFL